MKWDSLFVNNSLNLLYLVFTMIDPSRDGKEIVLIMKDTSSNFSLAVVTSNQQQGQLPKPLYSDGSTLNLGKSFDNKIITIYV